MARELVFSLTQKLTVISRVSQSQNPKSLQMLNSLYFPFPSPLKNRFSCSCSDGRDPKIIDMEKYKKAFSRRIAMAGLKPHHRIAMGVSGGPDSVALCVLTAEWKTDSLIKRDETDGCIDGLLAIVVDHGLRAESADEAHCVRSRVSEMGIRCEIVRCDWLDGRPKLGHLQEAARDMRYRIFQNVCIENQIGVLFIAHHADDQAELFILRLSRNSGVLGLAGMAFTSEIFPTHIDYCGVDSNNHGILLVRPLLEFSKEDMYKICLGGNQEWVEDPTNQSLLFARNRIRMSLSNISSCIIKSELQAIISACRKTRSFIDKICSDLINQTVTIMDHGYAIIDLEKLDPSNVEDVCLSKFVALVLQFISQRNRPVRGRTSKLLLNYIRDLPCKTSLTAAGCYLSAAPQSKGSKLLVCCSPHSSHPSEMELSHMYPCDGKRYCAPSEIKKIISEGKSYSDSLVPDVLNVCFLSASSSESVLSEGKRLNILSESTQKGILSLQSKETKHFSVKTIKNEPRHEIRSISAFLSEPLLSGQFCHFMNRFLITWRLHKKISNPTLSEEIDFHCNSRVARQDYLCGSCVVGHDSIAAVRHMIDDDWLYLANLSKVQTLGECQEHKVSLPEMDHKTDRTISCSDYVRLSAQRALQALKFIPVAARRGLPVLVNSQGLLLSIPSICFNRCPYISASAVFKPRVPLGGGHSSFI